MPVIPARLIAQIKREAGQAYTTTADILAVTGTQNPDNPYMSDGQEQIVASAVSCRVIYSTKPSKDGTDVSDKKAVAQQYRIAFAATTSVNANNLIRLADGGRWWVVGIDDTLTDKVWVTAIVERDSSNAQ